MRLIRHLLSFFVVSIAALAPDAIAGSTQHTTVITHGFTTGDKGIWVQTMAEAIIQRAGGGSVYRYLGSNGDWTYVPVDGADGTNYVIVLIFNWVPESAGVDDGPNLYYTQAAGDALSGALRDPTYVGGTGPDDLAADRFLHFMGHSRGPSVISQAVRTLGAAGIAVDHVTNLDPHPVDGTLDSPYNLDWADDAPIKWSNVTFSDTYWRADGGGLINGLDFDGIPIPNTLNTQLSESALNCCAYTFAHLDVHLWYHGTIDTSPAPCDGEQCINATARGSWYPAGWTEVGFYYAQLGGGAAERPAQPAGADPGNVPIIFNGGFTDGSYAGWSYHGAPGTGTGFGSIVNFSGSHALRLTNTATTFEHNRFFLPNDMGAVTFDLYVPSATANGTLHVEIQPHGEAAVVVRSIDLSAQPVNQYAPVTGIVPSSLRDQRVELRFVYEAADAGTELYIDNIAAAQTVIGDANGDLVVDVFDLLDMLSNWGACEPPCPPHCPADVNFDCNVDVFDILAALSNWS